VAHVSLITLGVEALDRAERFYVALGWTPTAASVPGTVTFLAGGTVVLALYGRAALAEDAGLRADDLQPPGAVAIAMNVPSEDEVDALLQRAVPAGGRITRPAERAEWGGYSGYLADPDGHLWEVAHNPGFALDEDGRITLPEA
jgi:uncharacterized protein